LPDYIVTSQVVESPDELEPEWLELQHRSDCSYFQSWGWIGTWLKQIALELKPVVIRVWHGESHVGTGLFVSRDIKRRIFVQSTAMFLNEYPFNGNNMVIEYNGLLAAKGHEASVYAHTANYLLKTYRKYDEFNFGAIKCSGTADVLLNHPGRDIKTIVNKRATTWGVDLDGIPPGTDGFMSVLSKNRRAQIRRSIRIFEEQGPIQIVEAADTDEALLFLDRLKQLHTQRWRAKGGRGSFSNPVWENFHRALVLDRFDKGEVQLVKVYNGVGEIGYLYNFIWRNHVYILQTGFIKSKNNYLMPGYVTHVYAIAYNKGKGMSVYDLMHGEDLYKKILCKARDELCWAVLQRNRLRFSAERLAVAMVRYLRGFARSSTRRVE